MKNLTDTAIAVVKKSRSASYPSINLEEAVKEIKKLRINLGKGPYNRAGIAQGIGYKGISGPASTKIATLVQFGLIERTGNDYKQTELTDHILFPNEDQGAKGQKALRGALIEALRKPRLYSALIERFDKQLIPVKLQNNLITGFGISDKVAESVAADFVKSAQYCGVIVNDIMKISGENDSDETEMIHTELEDSNLTKSNPINSVGSMPVNSPKKFGHESYPVNLPSGIIVLFPKEMSYQFAMGEFAEGIKNLEKKGQEILVELKSDTKNNASIE